MDPRQSVAFVNGITGESKDSDYKTIYQKAITFGFQALGTQISRVVANYLSRKYGLTLEGTFSNPSSLSDALEGTLGTGGLLIERRIVKSIYLQLSSPFDDSNIRLRTRQDFERYVVESQTLFQETQGRKQPRATQA
jgi:hypothetical protein